MKQLFTFLAVVFAITAFAQKEKTDLYIQQYSEIAIQEMMRTGVPAAIKLAQGLLESQSGESALVKHSNNHFGIKCKTEWTGAKTYHDDDERGECFRVYPNAEISYKDHSDFLRTRSHYNFLFKLDPTDYEAWAYGLKKAGYATSPTYPQSLIKVIKENQLDKYNLIAIERMNSVAQNNKAFNNRVIQAKPTTPPIENNQINNTTNTDISVAETITAEKEEPENKITLTTSTNKVSKKSAYPEGVFLINQAKVVYANEGISLLALANQYDITLSKLVEFNEFNNVEILEQDQLIFLEKKQKKGITEFHIAKEGESFHSIAQVEGIRLENLLQYNNYPKNAAPTAGNKIYLKPTNPIQATANKK